MAKLTQKQQLFVKEYLIDLNATQAAIRAGYSEVTAKEIGYENLTKPHIKEVIDEAIGQRSKRLEWTAEDIMRDLRLIAESKEEQTKDRLKAYELAGKHLKMFVDRVEADVKGESKLTVVFDAGMDDE